MDLTRPAKSKANQPLAKTADASPINQMRFANPTQTQLSVLKQRHFLDEIIHPFYKQQFPLNGSNAAKDEINSLIDYVKIASEDEQLLNKCFVFDKNLLNVFVKYFERFNADVTDAVNDIYDDTLPAIMKLKFAHSRVRPAQLAAYYNVQLFPYENSNTPSFPSGHTILAYVIAEVLGNHYPEQFHQLKELASEIAYSRLYMGVNFPTDNDFALMIYKQIIKDETFIKKYQL